MLAAKRIADEVEPVGCHADDILHVAVVPRGEGQGYWQGDKIHVGDVGEHLRGVPCKFGESPIDVDVWV